MSNVLDRAPLAVDQTTLSEEALDDFLDVLTGHMKPKAARKAREELEAFADRLETWQGCRLPANVTPLRGPRGVEQARATEAQRRERAERAAAIRALIGRAF